jgi:hypothetical protein
MTYAEIHEFGDIHRVGLVHLIVQVSTDDVLLEDGVAFLERVTLVAELLVLVQELDKHLLDLCLLRNSQSIGD